MAAEISRDYVVVNRYDATFVQRDKATSTVNEQVQALGAAALDAAGTGASAVGTGLKWGVSITAFIILSPVLIPALISKSRSRSRSSGRRERH